MLLLSDATLNLTVDKIYISELSINSLVIAAFTPFKQTIIIPLITLAVILTNPTVCYKYNNLLFFVNTIVFVYILPIFVSQNLK
ncbi:MAG TPA: hypothetical protein DCM02_13160 [Flavobacterium sp.]|nr:hypothetical protein [Flavobacterium sp.]HAT77300.1 hypothetical protein [Flavobacterium sp.]HAT81098.1 hypothetical protein [Flavobacterium sp.]